MTAPTTLPDFTPTSATGPLRIGATIGLGRTTTTEEQRVEALAHIAELAAQAGAESARMTVHWGSGDATILEATFSIEHVFGKRVWFTDAVREFTIDGSEIEHDEAQRIARLSAEVDELHDNGQI